jgi:hypothetical protein
MSTDIIDEKPKRFTWYNVAVSARVTLPFQYHDTDEMQWRGIDHYLVMSRQHMLRI